MAKKVLTEEDQENLANFHQHTYVYIHSHKHLHGVNTSIPEDHSLEHPHAFVDGHSHGKPGKLPHSHKEKGEHEGPGDDHHELISHE